MKLPAKIQRIVFLSLLLFLSVPGRADLSLKENLRYLSLMKPLEAKNQYPFYLPFLFMPFEQAAPSAFEGLEIQGGSYLASTFVDQYACFQKGTFDAETTVFFIEPSYTFASGLELRGYFSLIFFGPGFLDPVIENFHHGFKLPNGGRESSPSNRILLQWQGKNGRSFKDDHSFYGLSDPAFFVKKSLWGTNPFLGFSAGVKIPFPSKNWIRSGTFDLGMALHFDYYGNRVYLYATAGAVFMAGSGFYEKELNRKDPFSLHSGLGFGIRVSDSVSIFNQFYLQSSPYETGVSRMDNPSMVHSFGIRWQARKDFVLQVSADEDSFTFAMSDIAFLFQGEWRF